MSSRPIGPKIPEPIPKLDKSSRSSSSVTSRDNKISSLVYRKLGTPSPLFQGQEKEPSSSLKGRVLKGSLQPVSAYGPQTESKSEQVRSQYLAKSKEPDFDFAAPSGDTQGRVLAENLQNKQALVQDSLPFNQWHSQIARQIANKNDKAVKQLLKTGQHHINVFGPDDRTILHHLALRGASPDVIRYAAACGANFNLPSRMAFCNTPLSDAISNANNETALAIIQAEQGGIGINHQSFKNNTALHLAVGKGYIDLSEGGQILTVSNLQLAEELLKKGADPNLKNDAGHTPLHLAYIRRDFAMVELLIKYGALENGSNMESFLQECNNLSYEEAKKKVYSDVGPCFVDRNLF